MEFPHPLWAATLDSLSVDLLQHSVVMNLHVTDSSRSPKVQYHVFELQGVHDFHWFSSIPAPWNYAEVTEIHVRTEGTAGFVVDMMLWSEDAGLVIKAESVLLDGVAQERGAANSPA
jgi:hypothetical protein